MKVLIPLLAVLALFLVVLVAAPAQFGAVTGVFGVFIFIGTPVILWILCAHYTGVMARRAGRDYGLFVLLGLLLPLLMLIIAACFKADPNYVEPPTAAQRKEAERAALKARLDEFHARAK